MKILKNKIVYRDAVFVENLIRRCRFSVLDLPVTVFVGTDTRYETFFFQSRKNPFRLSLADI